MLGQAEVGFVLRIAIGFTVLVSMGYLVYTYMESAEKSKMTQFLEGLSDFVANQIATAIAETPENTTVIKKVYIPSVGDPFAGNYFITLEKSGSQVILVAKSYRWADVGVIKPLFINNSIADVGGTATPTRLCINVTRSGGKYSIYLVC